MDNEVFVPLILAGRFYFSTEEFDPVKGGSHDH